MSKDLSLSRPGNADAFDGDPRGLNLLGQSPAMKRVIHLALKVAPTDSTVLITGETGTGKELLARAIHAASRRSGGPFIAVNTSAIPENLQESELFGHRKGSFTGANADRRGLFEEAGGGTLLLDEVGDMSPSLQVKLLRTLQAGSIRRVGESVERPVDVRVIAATNRPLGELVAEGKFREDLFFRLNVLHLHLPPLRERGEDLRMLLQANLQRFAKRLGRSAQRFSQEAQALLESYLYPGNVRELENIVHHSVLMAEGTEVQASDLPAYLLARPGLPQHGPLLEVPREAWVRPLRPAGADSPGRASQREFGMGASEGRPFLAPALELGDGFLSLAEMEEKLIRATLERLKGNQSAAAKKLGVSRSTLWRKMKQYKIPV
jgi:DNA-binding NtrC family response regulator